MSPIFFRTCLHDMSMRGQRLALGSCLSAGNNICKQSIPEDLRVTWGMVRKGLNDFADQVGSATANAASVLVEITSAASPATGSVHRFFMLLAKAVYSPKFQLWVPCVFPERNGQDLTAARLRFPYEVDMQSGECRIGGGVSLQARTSDELASALAALDTVWALQRLLYTIPNTGNLLVNRVSGLIDNIFELKATERRSVNIRKEIAEMRGASRHRAQSSGDGARINPQQQASRSQPLAELGNRGSGSARQEPDVAPDIESLMCVHDSPADLLECVPAEVIEELATAADDEIEELLLTVDAGGTLPPVGIQAPQVAVDDTLALFGDEACWDRTVGVAAPLQHAAASSSSAPPPHADQPQSMPATVSGQVPPMDSIVPTGWSDTPVAATPRPICPEGTDISDPSATHYMYRQGRSIARLQPVKVNHSSMSIRCYLHGSECSLLLLRRHTPELPEVKKWLASAALPLPTDNREVRRQKGVAHINMLKEMRDEKKRAETAHSG